MQFRKTGVLQSGVISLLSNLLTTADDLNEYVKLFNQLDKDHGGFISKEELKNGLKMAPKSITTPDDEEWD
jgi:Ca2+-binding EF-hand superfamily protein